MQDSPILIRLQPEQRRQIENKAKNQGRTLTAWSRDHLIRALTDSEQGAEPAEPPELELLSLFCGPGGLDEGFRQCGFETTLALDLDPDSVATFGENHKQAVARPASIVGLGTSSLDTLYKERFRGPFRPLGVLGGPPCQSFSVSNVHQRDDDVRHSLPSEYARLLRALNKCNPISFFVFENVPGLKGKKHVRRYEHFKHQFEKAGFRIQDAELNAKDFGVPQDRNRVFIVGINQERHPGVEWQPPAEEKRVVTVRQAIGNLKEPELNGTPLDPLSFAEHPNHWCMVPRSEKFRRPGALKEGQAWGRSFRTLAWDAPSWTVAYGHREVHVHPNGRRRLSVYEAMRLQSFPKSYVLKGNITSQIRQISEAVPPRLAWHLAYSIRRTLGI